MISYHLLRINLAGTIKREDWALWYHFCGFIIKRQGFALSYLYLATTPFSFAHSSYAYTAIFAAELHHSHHAYEKRTLF